jgi:hypothetical protein
MISASALAAPPLLDGKVPFSTTDKIFADPDKVALWTKADSATHFEAIEITPLR